MYRDYALQPAVWFATPIQFSWDQEAGDLRGPDAARLHQVIDQAVAVGEVSIHPYPMTFDVSDPLHNMAEMAAVLGQYWQLPEDLSNALPLEEDAADFVVIESDGSEHPMDVQPIN